MDNTKEVRIANRASVKNAERVKAILLFLDNYLFAVKKYSRQSFAQALENIGLKGSKREIDYVLHYLEDIGISLKDSKINGYVLKDVDDEPSVYLLAHNLKKFLGLELINLRLHDNPAFYKYIQLESHKFKNITSEYSQYDGGLRWVDLCLSAIITSSKINLYHKNFEKGTTTKHKALTPLFVKEYLNRWYVVVEPIKDRDYTVFGLDRVEEIEITSQAFDLEKAIDFEMFDSTIGVDLRFNQDTVVLKFTGEQKEYIKTNFLHHSQRIIEDNESHVIISLDVMLNYELKRIILSYGANVEVLKPSDLRFWIEQEIKKMSLNYQ